MSCLSDGLFPSILQLSGQWGHSQEMSLYILHTVDPIHIHTVPITAEDGDKFRVSGA